MKVAVIGYGVEGQAAAKYWAKQGAQITVCDRNGELKLPQGYRAKLGTGASDDAGYLAGLGDMDLIVRSPGVRPDAILAANPLFPGLAGRITSSTREFLAQCPAVVVGVTGTKGKGTTSTLITKILEAAGRTVWLGGNIGRPALEFLPQVDEDDVVVLELSSFQLMDVERSPEVAVCLMMGRDHLDWHRDMTEYIEAKSNLFRYQTIRDLAIYKAGDKLSTQIAATSPGRQLPYGEAPGACIEGEYITMEGVQIVAVKEVGLVGPHNLENICAAVTATWDLVGRDPMPARQAIREFTGLEHRLELVAEVAGVKYYDDSFATTPETAMAAIAAFEQPKVMILGGSDKGASYGRLAEAVEHGGVIHALLIGDTAPKLATALKRAGFTHITQGITQMQQLVETCYHITEPGDVVLLSPACASFGSFANYKERGDQFKAAVADLAGRLAAAPSKETS